MSAGRRRTGWLRSLAGVVGLVLLGLIAQWYLSPHLVVDLANRVWSCF